MSVADGRPAGVILSCVCLCHRAASFTYLVEVLRCPHKRIVTITKVYIARNTIHAKIRGASYAEILSNVGLQTLKDRRDCICKNYFNSMKSETHKRHHLLPDERHVNYEMTQSKLYPLPKTRTNRYRNSFIPWGLRNCQ